MKAVDIYKIYMDLNEFVKADKKLPVRIGWMVARNLKKMEDIVKGIDEARDKLTQKYGERDENGNLKFQANGAITVETDKFMDEFTPVLTTEFDIDFDMITLAEIEQCDSGDYDRLSAKDMSALEFMVKKDEQ